MAFFVLKTVQNKVNKKVIELVHGCEGDNKSQRWL